LSAKRGWSGVLVGILVAFGACDPTAPTSARLRYLTAWPVGGTWSFTVDDHGQSATVLIDERPRQLGCDRAGVKLRCELRGLFPGGHTVEVRLAGAVLRRSVLLGKPWPARPILVRAHTITEAKIAAEAGADGVLVRSEELGVELADLVTATHKAGGRVVVEGSADAVELFAVDGVLGALSDDLKWRFPEARSFALDAAASTALAAAPSLDSFKTATALVEGHGAVRAALATLAPHGAIVDASVFSLLGARRRHAALRTDKPEIVSNEDKRSLFRLKAKGDEVLLLINDSDEPWSARPPGLVQPLDLLGSSLVDGAIAVRPHDVAAIVPSPVVDKTRY